jgi:hypothetical protein
MEWGWFTADTAIEGLKVAGANLRDSTPGR